MNIWTDEKRAFAERMLAEDDYVPSKIEIREALDTVAALLEAIGKAAKAAQEDDNPDEAFGELVRLASRIQKGE